ncbi:MAG: GNAT family N-acetyltransferase, partial [Brevundimonas sp.]
LAREALTALLDHVFATRDLPAAIADVDPRNARSLRLLEGLGFRRVGYRERTYRLDDGWADSVDLALDRRTWTSRADP